VSRRARACAFAGAAAICAALAAAATGGGESSAELGELRAVVVTRRTLPARRPLRQETVDDALELRRLPERFLPPDALTAPDQALGRRPAAPIPAGGYLVASQLRPLRPGGDDGGPRLAEGRRPVEIAVAGAGALAGGRGGPGRRVDVVVTTEPTSGAGAGRTFVAARAVGLLDLRPAAGEGAAVDPTAATDSWVATLALTRPEALRLIHAQSFARDVRLIGR
jgi:Flp pilus assembly protein CpaB